MNFIVLDTARCFTPPKACYACGGPIGDEFFVPQSDKEWSEKNPLHFCRFCITASVWFLDCFHRGAILGDQFPVNSYGPAMLEEIEKLDRDIGHNFHRTEGTRYTKGQNPLPRNLWHDQEHPR